MFAYQPLDSRQLARWTTPVACHVCGGANAYETELCRECLAPMALSHQASTPGSRLRMIAVLGAPASGKTTYLGMLTDVLSRGDQPLQLLLRGARSIRLQQDAIGALAMGRFPARTPTEPDRWNWLHAQARTARGFAVDFVAPDVSGEALMEEMDRPRTIALLRPFLTKCDGALLLIDAAKTAARDPQQEFAARKIIESLSQLTGDPRTGWPSRPLGIVLTKADACDSAREDPGRFLRDSSHALTRVLQDRLRVVRCFATSISGACAWTYNRYGKVMAPLRIEPRGVIEPFAWLVDRMLER